MLRKIQPQARPPITRHFDLADLSECGKEIPLDASEEERKAIAKWIGVDSVEDFKASVRLKRQGAEIYHYDAAFAVRVKQACVVTLEPVQSELTGRFQRQFRMTGRRLPVRQKLEVDQGGEDSPELTEGTNLDLIAPVLEELCLVVDPYPRAAGAVFTAESSKGENEDSPFAVLRKLQEKG